MTFSSPSVRVPASPVSRVLDLILPALQAGRLQIVLPNGDIIERHGQRAGPEASISLRRWRALWRIIYEGEDGFANGYIEGDWSTPDLAKLFELGMSNESVATPQSKRWWPNFVRNRIRHWLRANSRRGSRRNIAAHYDLGNDFFRTWLDSGMNYSSALYAGAESLEQAQERKLDRVAQLLAMQGGEHVLEIGCGWGALAEWLVRRYRAMVVGITLSKEQLAYATARLAEKAEDGHARLDLLDYREVGGTFDRIASIEMIEAVGERYWQTYFAKLRSCLREGGIAVIQAITIDERRFARYRRRPDFIQRHIFPGGMLPTRSIIEREAAAAGLNVVHHESFGDSYVRTLREWRHRFLHCWPNLEALGFSRRFLRMWEYYLVYCEVGFRLGAVDVSFFKFAG